jgi:hypothetical protein
MNKDPNILVSFKEGTLIGKKLSTAKKDCTIYLTFHLFHMADVEAMAYQFVEVNPLRQVTILHNSKYRTIAWSKEKGIYETNSR